MADNNFLMSFIVLMGTFFISRILYERALKTLDQQKKAELIDLFSKGRILNFAFVITIVLVYLAVIKYELVEWHIAMIIYIVLLVLFLVVRTYKDWKKLKQNNFPDDYIMSYLMSGAVRLIGIALFFLLIWI